MQEELEKDKEYLQDLLDQQKGKLENAEIYLRKELELENQT